MSEIEESQTLRGTAVAVAVPFRAMPKSSAITFTRQELNEILRFYGRMVSEGEWRDYAIDNTQDRAIFSVFRRACEFPLYRIEKCPRQSRRQGAFSVVAPGGLVLKWGHELKSVLKAIEKKRHLRLVKA